MVQFGVCVVSLLDGAEVQTGMFSVCTALALLFVVTHH